jgi:hypothetical protein
MFQYVADSDNRSCLIYGLGIEKMALGRVARVGLVG